MPAAFNSEEYIYTYKENTDFYLTRLDAAMHHYRTNVVNEKCVQRAVSDLLKTKYKLLCEREASPCTQSRGSCLQRVARWRFFCRETAPGRTPC